jgi:NADPH:quinone reductase-like Zn-dependent oxidoreductase
MKAIVCTRYGPPEVLQLREVKKPRSRANEVLIRILAVPVTTPDRRVRGLILPQLQAALCGAGWVGT